MLAAADKYGKLRVVSSSDTQEWTPVALMAWDGGDVRDAKLSIAADRRLMLSGAVRFLKPEDGQTHQSLAWFSQDGTTWSEPRPIGDPNLWMWSATWHRGTGYSIGYSVASKRTTPATVCSDATRAPPRPSWASPTRPTPSGRGRTWACGSAGRR